MLLVLVVFVSSCQTLDEKGSEKALMSVEEELVQQRARELEGYIRLIEYDDLSMKTLMRLTEGYMEAKEILYKKDMEEYEKKMTLYDEDHLDVEPIRPKQDYYFLVSHFRELIEQYRYGYGADAARYALGYALYEQGEVDEAVRVFEDLVRNYPWSDYFIEVSFRLGEFYFETGQMGEALEAYSRILEFPQSIFSDKANYKLAWVYYKLDEFEKAVDMFTAIIDKTGENELRKVGLMEEAITGIIMSFNHFKSVDQVILYMRSKGLKEYTQLVLVGLGDLFVKETKYNSAISVYNALAELFPDNPDLPFIYEKMADLYDRTKDKEAGFRARSVLLHQYNPATVWYKKNYPDGSDMVDALVSKTLLSMSKRYHLISKEGDDLENLENAIKGYRDFLVFFPRSTDYKEVNLLLAEALFDAGIYKKAALEYEKVILLYPEGPERTEMAYSLFLTYEVIFSRFEDIREETVRSAGQVLETYRLDFSRSDRLERVIYRIADMYREIGNFDKAIETLIPLTKGENPIPAYKIIASLYLSEGRLGSAEGIYEKLLEILDDLTLKEQLGNIRYSIAEDHLEAGRYDEAAAKFNQVFHTNPGSKVGEAALLRLGYIHIQKKDIDNLRDLVRRLVKVYPDSDGAASLFVEAGRQLEKEEPLKAARLYEDASAVSKDVKDAGKLIFASAMLYERNGEIYDAGNLFKRYLSLNEDIPIKNEAEARYRVGYVQLKIGKKKEGIKMLAPLMEWKGRIDDRLVAKASLLILKERQSSYLEIKLAPPFEETFKKKTLLLDNLLKEYSDIAEYRAPELLPEVFYQMGVALENFRDSLIHSERPQDLIQEDIKEYDSLLKEKALPYDEQAVKAYERSVLVGRKYKILNKWVEKSLDRLSILRPALHKSGFEEKGMEPESEDESP